jgi:hypothetical protein
MRAVTSSLSRAFAREYFFCVVPSRFMGVKGVQGHRGLGKAPCLPGAKPCVPTPPTPSPLPTPPQHPLTPPPSTPTHPIPLQALNPLPPRRQCMVVCLRCVTRFSQRVLPQTGVPTLPPPPHSLPLGARGVGWWWAVPPPSPPTVFVASQAPPLGPSTDANATPTSTRPHTRPPSRR